MDKSKVSDSLSYLSKDISIEGEVRGEENFHIEGRVRGSIRLQGNLTVGSTGVVEADIEADNIIIQGEVTGNITAKKQLEIQPTGKLIGDCSAASIDIREGAVFEGRSNMIRSPKPSGTAAAAEKPAEPSSTNRPAAETKKQP
jgi:cytoskeletal protein CcmA (bactofilin family)